MSHATVKHAVGSEHVEYVNLYNDGTRDRDGEVVFAYSANGAHALDTLPFWRALQTELATARRPRSGLTLKAELDGARNETVFSWCRREGEGAESCEEERRS